MFFFVLGKSSRGSTQGSRFFLSKKYTTRKFSTAIAIPLAFTSKPASSVSYDAKISLPLCSTLSDAILAFSTYASRAKTDDEYAINHITISWCGFIKTRITSFQQRTLEQWRFTTNWSEHWSGAFACCCFRSVYRGETTFQEFHVTRVNKHAAVYFMWTNL